MQFCRGAIVRLVSHDLSPGLFQNVDRDDVVPDHPEFAPELDRKVIQHVLNTFRKGNPKLIQKRGLC